MTIVYILIAILIFGVLIIIHELGHFAAAKACGVRVEEFAVGMGPAIFKKQKGETTYSLPERTRSRKTRAHLRIRPRGSA